MFRKIYSQIVLLLLISALSLSFTNLTMSQSDVEGNILYTRNHDTLLDAVFYETGQVTTFHEGECQRISPHLDFVVVVDHELFDQLKFINLATGQELSIHWQSTWNLNCTLLWNNGMDWLNNEILMMTSSANLDEVYYVNRVTASISGPYPEPTSPELPLYSQDYNIRAYSPNGNYVIYNRCREVECINSEFAIYNLVQQEFVAWLEGQSYIISRPLPAENFFSWSHSERYVVYDSIEHGIVIYNVANQEELTLSFLPANINQLTNRRAWSWKWSPNESKIAFWVSGTSRIGYSFDDGLAIVDLGNETFNILNVAREVWPRSSNNWGWSQSGNSILLVQGDNNLYEMNLSTGTQNLIDGDIYEIFFWYSGLES